MPRALRCPLFPAWQMFEYWISTQQSQWHGTLRLGHYFNPSVRPKVAMAAGWMDKACHRHINCCRINAFTQSLTYIDTQLSTLRMTLIVCLKILVCCPHCSLTPANSEPVVCELLPTCLFNLDLSRWTHWKLAELQGWRSCPGNRRVFV